MISILELNQPKMSLLTDVSETGLFYQKILDDLKQLEIKASEG